MKYFTKYLIADQLRMSSSKARENTCYERYFLFRSPATWTRKARQGTKVYEQWQCQKKAWVNNFNQWSGR